MPQDKAVLKEIQVVLILVVLLERQTGVSRLDTHQFIKQLKTKVVSYIIFTRKVDLLDGFAKLLALPG